MKTLIYCYRSGWFNNALGLALAGIFTRPLTCPPFTAETFPYEHLGAVDLIYIALHGAPKARMLRGDDGTPALDVDGILSGPQLRDGAVVILEGCYGAKTPFPKAFMERGARAVVASGEQTFDYRRKLGEAGRAGLAVVRALRAGMTPDEAVRAAGGYFERV